MRFGVTSTTPATRRRNLLGEDWKSGVAHTGKVAGRLLADVAFRYDAAGRLVKEGDRTYRYGYLDKVLSVTEGERTYTYDYHVDGQLARAVYGNGTGDDGRAVSTKPPPPASSEDFLWDGLALIKRGDERFVNEPHVGGGNPIASSKGWISGMSMFPALMCGTSIPKILHIHMVIRDEEKRFTRRADFATTFVRRWS